MKATLFLVLAALVAQLTFFSAFAQSPTGLREEATNLENIYTERAKTLIQNLVNEEDYTIIASVTLRSDEEKLKEYQKAVEQNYLPGLIVADPAGFGLEHNLLHDLKEKVEIQLVLSENVPQDREKIIKDILRSKLKLNEETGDSVQVVRALKKNPELDKKAPPKLAELSWKMILFYTALALLALGGLIFWLYKRREKAKAEAEAIRQEQELRLSHKEENPEEVPAPQKTVEEIEKERDAIAMKLALSKGELIKVAKEYTAIVCRAVDEYLAQDKWKEITMVMEALDWELSRSLFRDLSAKVWARIGQTLRERTEDPSADEVFKAVHEFHRFALSFVLERAGRDGKNPFSFIFQLGDSERKELLAHERPENLALIAIYCSGSQMGELLMGVSPEKQQGVLLAMTQIKRLPETEVKAGVDDLLLRLDRMKADPAILVDGPALAADFMRSLEPHREESVYEKLLMSNPVEAEQIRRMKVMFQDLTRYPSEWVREVLEGTDSKDVTAALVGYPTDFAEEILSLLPTKKALMIQNDLNRMEEAPDLKDSAAKRRAICLSFEALLEKRKMRVEELWNKEETSQESVYEAIPQFKNDEKTELNFITRPEPATQNVEPARVTEKSEDAKVLKLEPSPDSDEEDNDKKVA